MFRPSLECTDCGFVFSYVFDKWRQDDFELHVYNEDYILADPPFSEDRPNLNAKRIAAIFGQELQEKRVLDVGGGSGDFTHAMRQLGIHAFSYDPHFGTSAPLVQVPYDLVTAFEVIEHVPHAEQHEWVNTVASFLSDEAGSVAIISTEVRNRADSIDWWYICPRNGHVSIHTRESLNHLLLCHDLAMLPLGQSLYAVFRHGHQQKVAEMVHGWATILRGSSMNYAAG